MRIAMNREILIFISPQELRNLADEAERISAATEPGDSLEFHKLNSVACGELTTIRFIHSQELAK